MKKALTAFFCVLCALAVFTVIGIYSVSDKEMESQTEQNIETFSSIQAQTLIASPEDNIEVTPMGWWEDLWKIPEEINVYGTLHAGNKDTVVSDGTYTNQVFGYTAHADFPQFQVSTDGVSWGMTVLARHMMFSNTANSNGWKYFRSYKPDPKGDYSKVSRIYLDTVKPQIQVKINGSNVASGTVTASASAAISVMGSDSASGVESYWYKIGNGSYTQCYSSSTFTANGVYTFYAKDRAGNISDTVTVTKDTVSPSLYIYNGPTQLSSGSYTTAGTIRFESADTTIGVDSIYVKQPGSSSFTKYASSSVSFTAEGYYEVYAVDKANNRSSTYSVTVDRTKPIITVKSGSITLGNNTFINCASITVTSSESGICYVRRSSTGITSVFTNGALFTAEDTYTFYSYDQANNKSTEITVTIDRTAPTANIYAGGSVTSSAYTNASSIYYTASDKNGFDVFVKEPGKSTFDLTTNSKVFTKEGQYGFYSVDKAGNQSAIKTITVDRAAPSLTLYSAAGAVNHNSYVNTEYITASASDTYGIKNFYVKAPGAANYTAYTPGAKLYEQGTYYFYSEDNANNKSETKSVHLDKTAPTGTLYAGTSAAASDSYTNKTIKYVATDNFSGILRVEIKRPGGDWEPYTSGSEVSGNDGVYYFRCYDKAGNVSLESRINLDKTAPVIQIFADGISKENGSFSNAVKIKFLAFDSNLENCFVKIPGASGFTIAASGTDYTASGRYEFYSIDKAGNISGTYSVTVDRVKPMGEIVSNGTVKSNGDYINKGFKYTATDDASGLERLEAKKPGGNWETYISGTAINAGVDGTYYFRATDKAGNVSGESYVNFDITAPSVQIFAGSNAKPNGSFTNAEFIKFLAADMNLLGCFIKLPGEDGFRPVSSGTQFTASGRYEFYAVDKAGNISAVYSITIDKINPVGNLYIDGDESASESFTNKIFRYEGSDENGIAYYEIKRPGGAWEINTKETINADSGDGKYSFRCIDNIGNVSAESIVYLDTIAPIASLFAEAAAINSGAFTNASTIEFVCGDANLAACFVKLPGSAEFEVMILGTLYSADGNYEFYAVDKAGNVSEIYSVTLDKVSPAGAVYLGSIIAENGIITNQAFKYQAADELSGIARLEIKRPGSDWETYINGTVIDAGADGTYYFRTIDNAGNVSAESYINFDITAPVIGIFASDNAKPKGTFTNAEYIYFSATDMNLDSCFIKLPDKDGFEPVTSGTQFTASGRYEFYAVDKAGNVSAIYTITLDKINPVGSLFIDGDETESGAYTNKAFWFFGSDGISGIDYYEIKRPGGTWEIYTKETIDADSGDGKYSFRCIDNVGNVSAESIVYLDTAAPEGSLYAEDSAIASGTFTNALRIKFICDDAELAAYFVKLPGSAEFEIMNPGALYSTEGRYEFYAVDKAGNASQIYSVILDKTRPVGAVYFGDISVINGVITNEAFKYSASDELSGIARIEIKRPGGTWETYINGTETDTGTDGVYTFRAIDFAGNISAESHISFDITAPVIQIFAGSEPNSNNSFTNAEFIKFIATDMNLENCYIKFPGESIFQLVGSGAQFTASGKYQFYAADKAGNVSAVYSVTLDKVNPTGALFIDGAEVNSGSYMNKAFRYEGVDTISGVDYLEIKRPGGEWKRYTGEAVEADSANGKYTFRCVDKVGNVSGESVIYLDTVAPAGSLFAEDTAIGSGEFTNALRIKFVCVDGGLATCFVKAPGSSGFETTSSDALYSAAGRYEFYAVDLAGNVSAVYTLIIDRTPKTVTLGNVTNDIAKQDVPLSWQDTAGKAAVVSVTVNGKPVGNGSVIATINGGIYKVVCLDSAGNIWAYEFTANRADIGTVTSNKYWWEAKDGNKKTYAFETHEKALAFAIQRENGLVKALTWNNDTWDTGYIMDSIDSVNAKQGTFYLYKKHDDPKIEVAYFTLDRLNTVIRSYAEQDINQYYYWDKNPAESYTGNDLYKPVSDGTIIAKSLALRPGLTYKINGVVTSGTSYSTPGNHVLNVYDEFGNSYQLGLVIVSAAPDLQFRYGNGDYYSATNEQPYYLKNRITIKPFDSLDDFAAAIVRNSKGEIIRIVNKGEEFTISEVGKYIVQTVNHFGVQEYVFFISYESPAVYAAKNSDTKRLEVNIKPSDDKDIALLSLKIYWSANGSEWTLLDGDDYGLAIKTERLSYSFFHTGHYKIVVEDTCRSGIDAVILETYFEKPAPVGTLEGVNENGYCNGAVSFSWQDEAYSILIKDGEESEYVSGTKLAEEGSYRLIFRDYDGFEAEYFFIIDKTPAEPVLSGEIINGYVKESASITWEKEVMAILYFNGVQSGNYEKGTELFADGQYKVVLTDKAGNVTTVEFSIDTAAPTAELKGVSNGGQTKTAVKLLNLSETAQIKAYLNGEEFEYTIGGILDKVGAYRIVVTDAAGNTTEYIFEILYSVNTAGLIFIAIALIALISLIILIAAVRRKSKFKRKNKQKSLEI